MAKRRTKADWLRESDEWDKKSLAELIAESEPTDIKFVDARPKKAISLRIDEATIKAAKTVADDMGLGYQTLFRIWIREGLGKQKARTRRAAGAKKKAAA